MNAAAVAEGRLIRGGEGTQPGIGPNGAGDVHLGKGTFWPHRNAGLPSFRSFFNTLEMQTTGSEHAAGSLHAIVAKAKRSASPGAARSVDQGRAPWRSNAKHSAVQETSEKGSDRSSESILSVGLTPVLSEAPTHATASALPYTLQPTSDFPVVDPLHPVSGRWDKSGLATAEEQRADPGVDSLRKQPSGVRDDGLSISVAVRPQISVPDAQPGQAVPEQDSEPAPVTSRAPRFSGVPPLHARSSGLPPLQFSTHVLPALTNKAAPLLASSAREGAEQKQATEESGRIRGTTALQAPETLVRPSPPQDAGSGTQKTIAVVSTRSNPPSVHAGKSPNLLPVPPVPSGSSFVSHGSEQKGEPLEHSAHDLRQTQLAAAPDGHPAQIAAPPGLDVENVAVSLSPGVATHNAASAAPTDGLRMQQTFAAMETGANALHPAWTHATATTAEAGYRDPALGWVGVRAQVDADGIHAAVVPVSTSASETLQSHLPGLGSYLADHHVRLESLSIAPAEGSMQAQSDLPSGGSQEGQENRRGTAQPESEGEMPASALQQSPAEVALHRDGIPLQPIRVAGRGVYISVVA